MIERGEQLGFTLKSHARRGVDRQILGQNLQRDRAFESRVGRAIDDAHPARAARLSQKFVARRGRLRPCRVKDVRDLLPALWCHRGPKEGFMCESCGLQRMPGLPAQECAPRPVQSSRGKIRADMTIGFIGLGNMGRPMASNLVRKGFRVCVHDVARDRVQALEALGGESAADVRGVAGACDVVLTMLPDSASVLEVIGGRGGVIEHGRAGTTIVDMSTIDPIVTDRLAAEAAASGMAFADAPVGRLASHAERGESLFMVGATGDVFSRIKPMLEAMGTTIHHCGGVGTGMRTKLVNNYLAIISCQLNAEAVALSQRFGLTLEKTLDVIHGTTATNGQLKIAWPLKVLRGDVTPGFTIDLAHKDLTLIVEAANAVNVPVPIAAVAREAFSVARSRGRGGDDFSAMVDVLCDEAGIVRPRLQ